MRDGGAAALVVVVVGGSLAALELELRLVQPELRGIGCRRGKPDLQRLCGAL
jgi:hypothetical protein